MSDLSPRWLQCDGQSRLHRVATIDWDDGEWIAGNGSTICDRSGHMSMPGLLSRMEAQRCPRCCDVLGIPRGRGAPFNALKWRQADA